jgi:hypothetical protein
MSPNWQRNIGLLQIGFAGAIGSNGVEGLVRGFKACRRREHAATCIRQEARENLKDALQMVWN